MDLVNRIDWVGDDGVLLLEGRRISIERVGPQLYSLSASEDGDEAMTVVGLAALSYWLSDWSRQR